MLKQQRIPTEAVNDLEYFRDHIQSDLSKGLISQGEAITLTGFVNMIIRHITDGNEIEERMLKIMGGEILETLYEKAINEGKTIGIKQGIEQGIDKGDELRLIRLVIFNKFKGKKPFQMAEFLDEDLDRIEKIYEAIGDEICIDDPEEIYQKIHG